jgi:hypothetical protein
MEKRVVVCKYRDSRFVTIQTFGGGCPMTEARSNARGRMNFSAEILAII